MYFRIDDLVIVPIEIRTKPGMRAHGSLYGGRATPETVASLQELISKDLDLGPSMLGPRGGRLIELLSIVDQDPLLLAELHRLPISPKSILVILGLLEGNSLVSVESVLLNRLLADSSLDGRSRRELFRWALTNKIDRSAPLDALLGMDIGRVSRVIEVVGTSPARRRERFGNEEIWNLGSSMAMTDYSIFRELFSLVHLQPGSRIVEIGAGFGRMGFYLSEFHPSVTFKGFEIVGERVEESLRARERLGIDKSIEFVSQDLADITFRLPVADFYYAYCPVIGTTGQKVWAELIEASKVNRELRVLLRLALSTDGGSWPEYAFEEECQLPEFGISILKPRP